MTVCCRCVHAVLLLLLHGLAVVRNGSRKSARAEELKCACNECDELCFHGSGLISCFTLMPPRRMWAPSMTYSVNWLAVDELQ